MKKLNYFTAIGFLWKYIRRHVRHFIRFYLGWVFDLVLSVTMPVMFGKMIDMIVYWYPQRVSSFLSISLSVALLSVFSCVLYFFIYAQHHYLMNMYTFDIKRDLYKHIQRSDAEYLADVSTGDMIASVSGYSSECMHFVIRNIIHFSNGIFKMIILTVYLFTISPATGLFVMTAAPVSVLITTKFGKKQREYGDRQREHYGGYVSRIYEILASLREIRMNGAVKKAENEFEERHSKLFRVNIESGRSSMTAGHIMSLIALMVELSIYTFAAFLAKNGRISVGELTVILTFYGMLMNQIRRTSGSFLDAQNRVSYIQKIYEYMNSPVENEEGRHHDLVVTNGEVVFKDVNFSYKRGDRVLDHFDLKLSGGERTALVGKSGCGKSTVAFMLTGFYTPRRGEIIIDGQKLRECTLSSIRRNIGLVAQDVLIFEGTLRYNVSLGNPTATAEEVVSACRHAGLWDFIETLPDGLDTVLGSEGVGLSGGQKQRVAIARIYLKDPKIIIFDEATSSLDSETEKYIHEAWRGVLAGRTYIVIAHRHSSVMLCERVAVMENGMICEVGDPGEMEKHSKRFRELFALNKVE